MNRPNFLPGFSLDDRTVGRGGPVFVIAEIGVNHNGDLDLAKRTVEAAAAAGADCVKFQTFRAEEFMADRELVYVYENAGQTVREPMYEMFKRLELPGEWLRELFAYARGLGVVPLTSVADPVCLRVALEAGAPALKLASEDLINHALLREAATTGVPLILSTGMADPLEIGDALDILATTGCRQAAFLHCVSAYPTPDEAANLRRMESLTRLTGAPTGYSDHTLGVEACLAATAMGAAILEKHFTLDRSLAGPDHALSADPGELTRLVAGVRRIERMQGDGALEPGPAEAASRHDFRRSVVAARDLEAGTVLAPGDLALKRPGDGIRPRDMPGLYGRTLAVSVVRDARIALGMLNTSLAEEQQ